MTDKYYKIADKILEDGDTKWYRQRIALALAEIEKLSRQDTIKVMRQIQEALRQ